MEWMVFIGATILMVLSLVAAYDVVFGINLTWGKRGPRKTEDKREAEKKHLQDELNGKNKDQP